jgi:hypothetical protein
VYASVSDCLWLPRLENIYLYMKRLHVPEPRDANAEEHIKTGIDSMPLFLRERCIYVEDDLSILFPTFSRDRVPEPPDRMRQSPRVSYITCMHAPVQRVQKQTCRSIHLGIDLVPWSARAWGYSIFPFHLKQPARPRSPRSPI